MTRCGGWSSGSSSCSDDTVRLWVLRFADAADKPLRLCREGIEDAQLLAIREYEPFAHGVEHAVPRVSPAELNGAAAEDVLDMAGEALGRGVLQLIGDLRNGAARVFETGRGAYESGIGEVPSGGWQLRTMETTHEGGGGNAERLGELPDRGDFRWDAKKHLEKAETFASCIDQISAEGVYRLLFDLF